MLRLALAALYLVSAFVWAKPSCEGDLNVQISKNAYYDQKVHRIEKELLEAIVADGLDAWNHHYNCHEGEVFVFRERWPHRLDEDQGFRVLFQQDRHGRLWVEGVQPSDNNRERDYFQRLADCMHVDWLPLYLDKPLKSSRRVEIPPRVQVKLQEKHRFDFDDVQQAFANRREEPVPTRKPNVLEFMSQTDAGVSVRVLTTYDRSQDAWVLVSMFHPDRR